MNFANKVQNIKTKFLQEDYPSHFADHFIRNSNENLKWM